MEKEIGTKLKCTEKINRMLRRVEDEIFKSRRKRVENGRRVNWLEAEMLKRVTITTKPGEGQEKKCATPRSQLHENVCKDALFQ